MDKAQKREVVATLLKAGRRDLAKRFIGAAYTLDAEGYPKWPEPREWDVYPGDTASKYGDHRVMQYQYLGGNGIHTIVTFKGDALLDGGTATWDYEDFGKRASGTWKKMAEIPNILNGILKELKAARDKYVAQLERQLQMPGWELLVEDNSDLNYSKEPAGHTDWLMSVTFFDAGDSPETRKKHAGSWNAGVVDHGTYENVQENQDDGSWKTFKDIPKVLKQYEKSVEKHLGR